MDIMNEEEIEKACEDLPSKEKLSGVNVNTPPQAWSVQRLGRADTVGELQELLKAYPAETSFGFRNQRMQELYEMSLDEGEVAVVFQ